MSWARKPSEKPRQHPLRLVLCAGFLVASFASAMMAIWLTGNTVEWVATTIVLLISAGVVNPPEAL